MAEYIEKEKLLYEFREIMPDIGINKLADELYNVAFNLPSADVAPVKHGMWIWNPNGMDWGLGAWECSECASGNNNLPMNNRIHPLLFVGSKFCPHCGAKMEG